jgi:hyperosmotically inducible protein
LAEDGPKKRSTRSAPHPLTSKKETIMNASKLFAAMLAVSTLTMGGCAVTREQSTVGQYVDDSTITTQVKARFAESPVVSAMAIKVETLNGTVQLSGFAKNATERDTAESIARKVPNVKAVKNDIVVKP